MTIPAYERLSNDDPSKAIYTARRIMEKGWRRRGYNTIVLTGDIPWNLTTEKERSHNFYIHAWDFMENFLEAHSSTKNPEFLTLPVRLACDWIEKHDISKIDDKGISPFAWYDMTVGLRAYRLAYIIDAGEKSGTLDTATKDKLWSSLLQHHTYLADDANIAFHNNHGYYQIAGQLAMGRRFSGISPEMAQASAQGNERLKRILDRQFAPDGVHREHSPDYHRMVYETLKVLINSGLIFDPGTVAFAAKIEHALSWFIFPNRRIVNFGDSDYRLLARKPAEAQRKWTDPAMRYMVTDGEIGALPAETFMAFEQGGYFIVRQPSVAEPQKLIRSSYLAQNAAFHSRTHKHADDLSFVWFDRGHDILVDAGRYGYIGKTKKGSDLWAQGYWYEDPNRIYVETTRAHNTLEFDETDYPRKVAAAYGSATRRWARHESGLIAMETENKHFKSIRHARIMIFMPAQWLLVFDWFHDNKGEPHDVKQWFHVAPHLRLTAEDDGYMATLENPEPPLRIAALLPGATPSRLYLGEEGDKRQGWWSAQEREIIPNYAFCYEAKQKTSDCIATIFSFSEKLETDRAWSKANVSGRKAQFRWTDDQGRHDLFLDRPAEGEMTVTYGKK